MTTIPVQQPPHQQTQQEWQQVAADEGISYLTAGQGPAVLFLHGLGGAARHFTPQLKHFASRCHAPRYHALAWDMPGTGASVPLPLVTMDSLAAALAGFIRAARLARPVLVGHSLGGMVALHLLAEAPDVASALVLAQTSAAFGGKDPAWADQFIADRLRPLDAGRTLSDLAPELVQAMTGDAPDPDGLAIVVDCLAHTPDSTYRDHLLAMRGFDRRAALDGIKVPTLVIAARHDLNAPAAASKRMAGRIPGARYAELDDAGHLAHLERPACFNAALDEFLQTVP